jgi:hypothetical protein
MVSPKTTSRAPNYFKDINRVRPKTVSAPPETLAQGARTAVSSKRFDSIVCSWRFLAGIFRYGIRFCFTIMIDSRSAQLL